MLKSIIKWLRHTWLYNWLEQKKYWFVWLLGLYEFGFFNFFENQKRLERLVGISHTNHTTDINISHDTTLTHITHWANSCGFAGCQAILLDAWAWCQAKIDELAHYILNLKTRKHSNQRILGHKAAYHGYYIIRARKRRGLHVDRTIFRIIFLFCFLVIFFSCENDSYLLLMFFCLWLPKLACRGCGFFAFSMLHAAVCLQF